MFDIPEILVLEPSSEQSKRRAAAILARKEAQPELESIKNRLREIRTEARRNHPALLADLKATLGRYPGLKLHFASHPREAAAHIEAITDGVDLTSLNKSNVVVNEIRPELRRRGRRTYLRYFNEFGNFDQGRFKKEMVDYWSLPGMHERGMVESFAIREIVDNIDSPRVQDYTALLGVNAISATDGAVFFLQHMSNITKDLRQAKRVIFLVGLDKIVPAREEARLQTQAMGIFGLESTLLDLAPHEEEVYDFDALPILANPSGGRELHLILFDNGRSEIINNDYRDLFLCIDCRACARQCPVGLHLELGRDMLYSPKNYLLGFLQGLIAGTEACLHCGRCQLECPVDINLPELIWKAQFERYAQEGRGWKKRLLDDPELLARLGSWTAPLSNWAVKLPPIRAMMQLTVGVHRRSPLPTFSRRTFRGWFKGGRHG